MCLIIKTDSDINNDVQGSELGISDYENERETDVKADENIINEEVEANENTNDDEDVEAEENASNDKITENEIEDEEIEGNENEYFREKF